MVNLMRPDVKKEKLGKDLSRLVTMLHDKEFRRDAISTLSRQIYHLNIDRLQPEGWKALVSTAIQQRDLKNRFVDTLQLQRRPGLCRMGCHRLRNPDKIIDDDGNETDRRYDTCCPSCANWKADSPPKDGKKKKESKKEPLHELRCDKRHYYDWRQQIRDEAMKSYLKAHPLEQIPIPRDPEQEEKAEFVAKEQEMAPRVRFAIPERSTIQHDLIQFIAEELKYHATPVLVSAMLTRYINPKSLKTQLQKMEHGSIVELLIEKFERMFKFKVMCSLTENDVTKLDLSTYANPKSFPEWWSLEWTKCLLDGTMQNGWGNVPREFAMEKYGFTKEYKGPKKLSKKEQEEKKRLEAVQKLMGNVEITNGSSSSKSGTTTPSEPVLIVKKRQWVQEGLTQQKMMISICNHKPLKKSVSDEIKRMKTEMKKMNDERKERVNGPSKAVLKAQEIEKAKAAQKAEKERRKQEKQERKRERKERKEMEKMMRNKEKNSNNAVGSSQFNELNNITNYFSASLKNMPAGTRNAFDLLGKKPQLSKEERKKKKKAKQLKRAKEQLKLDISFDEKGNFKVPIKLGKTALIKSLGTICLDQGYHGLNVISPIGYTVCHSKLPSFKRPGKDTVFTTTIKRGVDGPCFEVTCSDDTEFKVQGRTASGVWTDLQRMWLELEDGTNEHNQKMTDAILNHKSPTASPQKSGTGDGNGDKSTSSTPSKKKVATVSGPRKIGLAHPDIKRMIECMPNAKNCKNYRWKYRTKFEENERWTPKKAFDRTFKRDKDGEKKRKRSKSKSPHKHKKRKKTKSPTKIINNVNNVNIICIENNISTINNIPGVNAMSNAAAAPSSSGIPNMQPNVGHHPHPMSSSSDPKNNVIVIEDSPSVSASVPARVVSVSPQKSDAISGTLNRVNLDLPSRSQSTLSEVIDLCESDNESKDAKKSRKRKHPSGEEMGGGSDDSDMPTKKRKVEGM